jgi:AraC-type DNA-binding domain-containing proteins
MLALTPAEIQIQLHIFVDELAHEGIQNHVEIYPFIALRNEYHQRLEQESVNDYYPIIVQIAKSFDKLMQADSLSFTNRLESTLDIIYYINSHLYDRITVREVLEHANQNCNPTRAKRNFALEMNMSISDFISLQRMREAQHLLKATDEAVQDIAKKLGFYDLNEFSHRFKRKIGVSPLTYRQYH